MFEWLAAAATSVVLGTSTDGMLQRFRTHLPARPQAAKQRTYASADIQCVAAAVAARETALSAGATTHGNAVVAAYSARATALADAYAATGNTEIKNKVKAAWGSFKSSVQSARKAWQTARESAWSAFRTGVKSCGAPADIVDTSNASSEATGG